MESDSDSDVDVDALSMAAMPVMGEAPADAAFKISRPTPHGALRNFSISIFIVRSRPLRLGLRLALACWRRRCRHSVGARS